MFICRLSVHGPVKNICRLSVRGPARPGPAQSGAGPAYDVRKCDVITGASSKVD